jgi:glycosyl transferase family 25
MQKNKSPHHIDAVYVLSVKTFSKRIEHIRRELSHHKIDFQFIFDHDLGEIDATLEANIFGKEPAIEPPQRSLVLKHITAWENCLKNNYKNILVLEDDVVLNKNFTLIINKVMQSIQQKKSGYLVFLGGADTRVPKGYFLTNEPIFENPIATADGYITDLTACEKRLNWLANHKATLPADHLLKKIDAEERITQYWSTQPLVEQGSVFGLFTSTLDGKRKAQSNIYNLIRYKIKIFTRRSAPKFFHKLLHKILK